MQATIILKRRVSGVTERVLQRFVARACRAAGMKGAVTVLIGGNRELKALNRRFAGKSYATDVLSFPPPPFADGFAGDIAISLDIATRNARELGHSVHDEVRILILHGILHLAGYDHENDHGLMAGRELDLRRKLALPASLIERMSTQRTRRRSPARSRV